MNIDRFRRLFVVLFLIGLVGALAAQEGKNMIGRQSQNEGLLVLPKPGDMTIDGKLNDWDLSGRIWVFADKDLRSQYSVKASAMWDKECLYLAARWNDPTPMYSTVNPEFNPADGWKSDSWQMRVVTDQPLWITTWFYTPQKKPVLHLSYWKNPNNARDGQDITLLQAKPGGTKLGKGAEMAYRQREDGGGYVQEVKIPWELLYDEVPAIQPGLVFKLGCEFLWGDPTGQTWPIHRYADNMQPGFTSREFYWTNRKAWGDARLVDRNNVPKRPYVSGRAKLEGTIPLRIELPTEAARFSLVIEDPEGNRLRNMADLDPVDYTIKTQDETRIVEVPWDGLKDSKWVSEGRKTVSKPGDLVDPGTYRVRGLYHEGLGAEYEMCFYNPGNPPWRTRDGTGAWGANHVPPENVAAAGERMIVGWRFSEGGHATICVGPDGRKTWGELRGAAELAADQQYVYTVPGHREPAVLNRFSATDGTYRPFVMDEEEREFDLQIDTIFGKKASGEPTDLAADGGRIAVALRESDGMGRIGLLDAGSAALLRSFEVPSPTGVALREIRGTLHLYAILNGQIHRLDLESGDTSAVKTPGLDSPSAIAIDADGNIVVADIGPDSQVKAYAPNGKLAYTCGKKGGRPIRGEFNTQAMVRMSSVAVDAKGQIWVTENWNFPRRVSIWDREGRLVRDYVGNTGYAGTGCYLHDQDPTLAYCGPIEMKLDHENRSWEVTRVLWVPDPDVPGEVFPVKAGGHKHPQRFRSDASGEMHEYLYVHDPRDMGGQVIYMERETGWQPVAAICLVGHISGDIDRRNVIREMPTGEFKDLNPHDGVFWNDENRDARVQRSECEIIPTEKPGKLDATHRRHKGSAPLSLDNGWGGRIDTGNFNIYTNELTRYAPSGFTDDGAPIYTPDGMDRLAVSERGDLVPVPEENRLLCLSRKGYAGPTTGMLGIDLDREKITWSYPNPFPGVHGSHRAPMPRPGLLIGPLKILGVANVGGDAGRVLAMRGNLGQDYFMTTDGLFVGTLFRDGRLPSNPLPSREKQLLGRPMGTFSEGGEPFSGWFGRQADGIIRMTTSMARTASMIVRIKGLETLRRFEADPVKLDTARLAQAERANAARAAAAEEPKTYTVERMQNQPKIDGKTDDWKGHETVRIQRASSPRRATARLAYDATNLYLLMDVADDSPWTNSGKDFSRLFKTGDAVDLQLHAGEPVERRGRDPVPGDLRIVMAPFGKGSAAVLMQPVDADAPDAAGQTYTSPIMTKRFDRVEILKEASVAVTTSTGQYTLEAAIPLEAIGLEAKPGQTIRGDLGFISSDAGGTVNVARTYWSNEHTNLVNDLPSESWLYPESWGRIRFE